MYVYKSAGELLAAASDAPQRANDRADYIRAVIASGVHAAHTRPVFVQAFKGFVAFGDSIETHHNGYRIAARIEHDDQTRIDDDDCHSEDQERTGCTDEQHAQLMAARRAWFDNEWHYCGVVLSVTRDGVMLDEHAASLWGIECNYPGSDNSYLNSVANELLPEALAAAETRFADLLASRPIEKQATTDAREISAQLEHAIDARGLPEVLNALAAICYEKADHIEDTWQDIPLAKLWRAAGLRVETCGFSKAVGATWSE